MDRNRRRCRRTVENLSLNASSLELRIECADPEGCYEEDPPPDVPWGEVSRIEIVARDLIPPQTVSAPTGTLLADGPLAGTVNVHASYRDRGGGVRSLALFVDGAQAADSVMGVESCRVPSAYPVPCPLTDSLELAFDTTRIADGPHRVEVELQDIAGNRAVVASRSIVVRNAAPAAAPLTPGRLTMTRYVVRASYGARTVLEGALTDLADGPLAGAQVQVESRPKVRNAVFLPMTTVLTDASGRFVVPIPRGPSRQFRIRYAMSETSAELDVPAPVRLKVSPAKTRNAKTVRFMGSIPGTDASTRVELQALAGRKWIPFRTATLSNGRFSARYKFTNTTSTHRYRFRAVVRKDANFPYAPATSLTVRVLVRP